MNRGREVERRRAETRRRLNKDVCVCVWDWDSSLRLHYNHHHPLQVHGGIKAYASVIHLSLAEVGVLHPSLGKVQTLSVDLIPWLP